MIPPTAGTIRSVQSIGFLNAIAFLRTIRTVYFFRTIDSV